MTVCLDQFHEFKPKGFNLIGQSYSNASLHSLLASQEPWTHWSMSRSSPLFWWHKPSGLMENWDVGLAAVSLPKNSFAFLLSWEKLPRRREQKAAHEVYKAPSILAIIQQYTTLGEPHMNSKNRQADVVMTYRCNSILRAIGGKDWRAAVKYSERIWENTGFVWCLYFESTKKAPNNLHPTPLCWHWNLQVGWKQSTHSHLPYTLPYARTMQNCEHLSFPAIAQHSVHLFCVHSTVRVRQNVLLILPDAKHYIWKPETQMSIPDWSGSFEKQMDSELTANN